MQHFSGKTKDYVFIFIITFVASLTALLLVQHINYLSNQDEELVTPQPAIQKAPLQKALKRY